MNIFLNLVCLAALVVIGVMQSRRATAERADLDALRDALGELAEHVETGAIDLAERARADALREASTRLRSLAAARARQHGPDDLRVTTLRSASTDLHDLATTPPEDR